MPPNDEFRVFSLRLPADLDAELRRKAQQHDRSAGAELRSVLREHIAREKAFEDGFTRAGTPS